jgi:hypothetical protein
MTSRPGTATLTDTAAGATPRPRPRYARRPVMVISELTALPGPRGRIESGCRSGCRAPARTTDLIPAAAACSWHARGGSRIRPRTGRPGQVPSADSRRACGRRCTCRAARPAGAGDAGPFISDPRQPARPGAGPAERDAGKDSRRGERPRTGGVARHPGGRGPPDGAEKPSRRSPRTPAAPRRKTRSGHGCMAPNRSVSGGGWRDSGDRIPLH